MTSIVMEFKNEGTSICSFSVVAFARKPCGVYHLCQSLTISVCRFYSKVLYHQVLVSLTGASACLRGISRGST